MQENYSHICLILDRSGSMNSVKNEIINGINVYLQGQIDENPCTCTLVQFDTEYEVLYLNVPIKDVAPRNLDNFIPRGSTALLDAIGKSINDVGHTLSLMNEDERPGKVVVVIVTDGQENASRNFNKTQITEMIKHQQEAYNWEFVFIGCDANGIQDAYSYGINVSNTAQYNNTSKGIMVAFAGSSAVLKGYRSGNRGIGYTDDEKEIIQNTK